MLHKHRRLSRQFIHSDRKPFRALAAACVLSMQLASCSSVPETTPASTPDDAQTPIPRASPQPLPRAIPSPASPVPAQNVPAKFLNPADLIFFDSFEYVVNRDDPTSTSNFQIKGRWNGVKTIHTRQGANGYLYTTAGIPGHSGAFPGDRSKRVLVMEALPNSRGFQTDFYLEYGDSESTAFNEAVPGNVWFQFWIFVNHNGSQRSRFGPRNKLIYACNGAYPCHSHKWMLTFGTNSGPPRWRNLGMPSDGGAFLGNAINSDVATVANTSLPAGDEWKLGQTNTSRHITANRWTLVKIHLDTSTQSGRYEAWIRPLGRSWTKVVEWIDGVTPGFTWKIHADHIGGHRSFRMPTTIGHAKRSAQNHDAWVYLDDFSMARSESGLPQYAH